MQTSQSVTKITEALINAAAKITPLVKGSENPFFNSKYADLNQTIESLRKVLLDEGLWFMQFPTSTDNSVGVVTRVVHSSSEFIEHEFVLPLAKRDPQAAGSAITYARRYALVAIFGLQAVDDDAQSAMPTPIDEISVERIENLLTETGKKKADLVKHFGVKKIADLTSEQGAEAIGMLEWKKKQQLKGRETDDSA
mgnify:CR=1 FL=1